MPRTLLLICAVLVCAAPALGGASENRLSDRTSTLVGNVTALGAGTITVRNDKRGGVLKCSLTARSSRLVARLEVGRRVAIRCRGAKGTVPQLAKITLLPQPATRADTRALENLRGSLADPGKGKVAVTSSDARRTLSCRVPPALAATVAALTIGDHVLMACRGGKLVAITKTDEPARPGPTPIAAPTPSPTPAPVAEPARPAASPTPMPTPVAAPTPVTPPTPVAKPCLGVQVGAGADLRAVTGRHGAGTTFCLAAGEYIVTEKVMLDPGDVISGAGRSATVITAAPGVRLLFDFYWPASSGGLTFEHLSMGGANTPLTASCTRGSCGSVMLSGVAIRATDVRCFGNATTCFSGGTHDLVLDNFECDGNGWHPDSLAGAYQSSACIKLHYGSLTVTDSSFHDNTWDAIWVDTWTGGVVDIRNSRFVRNGRAGFTWEVSGDTRPGDRAYLQGNTFLDNGWNPNEPFGSGGHAGIIISDGSNIEITGNTFKGNLALDQPGTRAVLMYDGSRYPQPMHHISIHDNTLNQDRIQTYNPVG